MTHMWCHLQKAPNGRVIAEEKSRSAVTSMSASNVFPVAPLKRLMSSAALPTETESAHTHTTKPMAMNRIGTRLVCVIMVAFNSMKTLQPLFACTKKKKEKKTARSFLGERKKGE